MPIKKFRPLSPDPYVNKIKGDTEFARLAHINHLIDEINSNYTYLEVPIDSATLITPPPIILPGAGPGLGDGVLLLPELLTGSGKYYEWKLALEFYPGSTPYNPSANTIYVSSEVATYPNFYLANITQNKQSVWQTSSESSNSPNNQEPESFNIHLRLTWNSGDFVGGDGTMKAKIWYKIVNFG